MVLIRNAPVTVNHFSIMKNRRLIFLFFGFILSSIHVQKVLAQQEDTLQSKSLEELLALPVEGVGFFDMNVLEAPGYNYIYENDEIIEDGLFTLEDIINQHVPGNLVGRHNFEGSLHGVRGVLIDNDSKTSLLFNGQNINQRCYYGSPFLFQSPFMGDIKRIEFLNGPSSIINGSGANNGLINLIMKNGKNSPGLNIEARYGATQNMTVNQVAYGKNWGENKNIFVFAGIGTAKGFKSGDRYQYQFPTTITPELKQRIIDYPRQAYEKPALRFSANFQHNNFSLTAFYNQILGTSNALYHPGYWRQRILGAQPIYKIELSKYEGIELIGSCIMMDDKWLSVSQDYEFLPPGEEVKAGGRESSLELKSIFRTIRIPNNQFAFGMITGKRFLKEKMQYFSDPLPFAFATTNTSWEDFTIFLENIYSFKERLQFSAGLRFEHTFMHNIYGTSHPFTPFQPKDYQSITPRLALSYNAWKNGIIKLVYQNGYRNPEAGQYPRALFVSQIVQQDLGYPEKGVQLIPEKMHSFELNFSQGVSDLNLFLFGNIYYNIHKNTLTYTFYSEHDAYLNLNQEEIDIISNRLGFGSSSMNNLKSDYSIGGFEVIAKQQWKNQFSFELSYSNVNYFDLKDSSFIHFPKHLIKGNLSLLFIKKLTINTNFHYYPGFTEIRTHEVYKKDRFLLNFVFSYRITKTFTCQFSIQNALANQTPPVTFEFNPNRGGLGFDKRFYYANLVVDLFGK